MDTSLSARPLLDDCMRYGEMSSASFQIVFEGNLKSGLPDHEIDVKELSGALAALGRLFETADDSLNEGRTRHTLKVKGSFKTGSFRIDFTSWQGLVQKAKDIIGSQSIVTSDELIDFLIFGGAVGADKVAQGKKAHKSC